MSKHIDLLIGWPLVVGATVVGCLYTQNDPESWAQVVILGVTAMVVVYYAHQARRTADEACRTADEARRTADETRSLAQATQSIVEINRTLMEYSKHPELLLEHSTHVSGKHQTRIVNRGRGPARDIKCRTLDKAGVEKEIPVADLAPGATGPNILATEAPDPLYVSLNYNDVFDKPHGTCWQFDGTDNWFPISTISFMAAMIAAKQFYIQ